MALAFQQSIVSKVEKILLFILFLIFLPFICLIGGSYGKVDRSV